MQIYLKDHVSLASDSVNEDRAGLSGNLAWVIDGATDVLEENILPGPSDAAWFASELSKAFFAASHSNDLTVAETAKWGLQEVSELFSEHALRPITHNHENPSAAGVLVQLREDKLHWFALGDCSLIQLQNNHQSADLINEEHERDGDKDVRQAAQELAKKHGPTTRQEKIRAELMPMLREKRDQLNKEDGYGIFSLSQPPEKFIQSGMHEVESGDVFLLASDGFMRLVDVYGELSLSELGETLTNDGLSALMVRLRNIENADKTGQTHPRAKTRDDATALIFQVV